MKSNMLRVKALENRIRSKPKIPACVCRMKDGGEKRFFGMMVLQPFLDDEIAALATNDADLAEMLRQMDTDGTVEITII